MTPPRLKLAHQPALARVDDAVAAGDAQNLRELPQHLAPRPRGARDLARGAPPGAPPGRGAVPSQAPEQVDVHRVHERRLHGAVLRDELQERGAVEADDEARLVGDDVVRVGLVLEHALGLGDGRRPDDAAVLPRRVAVLLPLRRAVEAGGAALGDEEHARERSTASDDRLALLEALPPRDVHETFELDRRDAEAAEERVLDASSTLNLISRRSISSRAIIVRLMEIKRVPQPQATSCRGVRVKLKMSPQVLPRMERDRR